jgi:hypothetical protein
MECHSCLSQIHDPQNGHPILIIYFADTHHLLRTADSVFVPHLIFCIIFSFLCHYLPSKIVSTHDCGLQELLLPNFVSKIWKHTLTKSPTLFLATTTHNLHFYHCYHHLVHSSLSPLNNFSNWKAWLVLSATNRTNRFWVVVRRFAFPWNSYRQLLKGMLVH